jgi:putative CocE/NonD family hydrolase
MEVGQVGSAADVIVERDIGVPVRDGTILPTEIYRPARSGEPIAEPTPTLLCRTPYGIDRWRPEARFLAERGYTVALQDWRQTGKGYDSSQWRPPFEGIDGYDTVEWLASQPWSTGQVGMWGHSAMGQAIQAILPLQPPSLKSVFVIDTGLDYGSYPARQNGAFGMAFRLRHTLLMAHILERDPNVRQTLRDAYLNPDKYFSIFKRPHAPIERGRTVLALSPALEDNYLKTATIADLDDPYWKDGGETEEELMRRWKDIPMCFISGWYANHLTANVTKYKWLSENLKSPIEMVVGHWDHHMDTTFAGGVDFGPGSDLDVFGQLRVDWFDRTLRRREGEGSKRIRYLRMGGGSGTTNVAGRLSHGSRWLECTTWPPAGTSAVPYYFRAEGKLSVEPPVEDDASRTYTFDPRDPVTTAGGNFCEYTRPDYRSRVDWMADGGAQDQRGNSKKPFCKNDLPLATREDVLVFETEPLESDVVVTGELLARIWVSSTAVDTDFTVKLIDVHPHSPNYPEGFAMNLQDAVVRMRYRNGRRKPDLIQPGEVYEVELPFHSTSNLFKRGHRIRVDVSSSNFPRIDVNPNTGGPLGVPGPVATADNTVYFDKARPSHVVLPIAQPT